MFPRKEFLIMLLRKIHFHFKFLELSLLKFKDDDKGIKSLSNQILDEDEDYFLKSTFILFYRYIIGAI